MLKSRQCWVCTLVRYFVDIQIPFRWIFRWLFDENFGDFAMKISVTFRWKFRWLFDKNFDDFSMKISVTFRWKFRWLFDENVGDFSRKISVTFRGKFLGLKKCFNFFVVKTSGFAPKYALPIFSQIHRMTIRITNIWTTALQCIKT
jgi:hypothetical protein